jgi:ParB/RepB/Spo0J family partition protein
MNDAQQTALDWRAVRARMDALRAEYDGMSFRMLKDEWGLATHSGLVMYFKAPADAPKALDPDTAARIEAACAKPAGWLLYGIDGERGPLKRIAIDDVAPDPAQPRKHFDVAAIEDLALSINREGLIQPIEVRPNPDKNGPPFLITTGERRWRACRYIVQHRFQPDFPEIHPDAFEPPCIVRETAAAETLARQMVENLQRLDMTEGETIQGLAAMRQATGETAKEIAFRLGKHPRWVQQRLKIRDDCAEAVLAALADGRINFAQARALSTAPAATQERALPKILEGKSGWRTETDIQLGLSSMADPDKWEAAQQREAEERRAREAPDDPLDDPDGLIETGDDGRVDKGDFKRLCEEALRVTELQLTSRIEDVAADLELSALFTAVETRYGLDLADKDRERLACGTFYNLAAAIAGRLGPAPEPEAPAAPATPPAQTKPPAGRLQIHDAPDLPRAQVPPKVGLIEHRIFASFNGGEAFDTGLTVPAAKADAPASLIQAAQTVMQRVTVRLEPIEEGEEA